MSKMYKQEKIVFNPKGEVRCRCNALLFKAQGVCELKIKCRRCGCFITVART